MGFPAIHHYVTIIGDSYVSAERWQFGFRLSDGGASNQATALAIAPHVENWWRGVAPYGANNVFNAVNTHRLTELKVARINTDGSYVTVNPDATPAPGAYSHFYLPAIAGPNVSKDGTVAQNTVAVTLTTALPRGLASKGRIYLPPSMQYVVSGAGIMSALAAQEIGSSIRTLINLINAEALVGNVQILSKGKGVANWDPVKHKVTYTHPTVGAAQNVTGVRCGRVIDTQRRRRRGLVEQPYVAAL